VGPLGPTTKKTVDHLATFERAKIGQEFDRQILILLRESILGGGGKDVAVDGATNRTALDLGAQHTFGLQGREVLTDRHRREAQAIREFIGGKTGRAAQRVEDLPPRCPVSPFHHPPRLVVLVDFRNSSIP
jgi:hypothetical protein